MTSVAPVPCFVRGCKHFFGLQGPPEDGVYTCYAFPTGIPPAILDGKDDHTKPQEGDDGITFERGPIDPAVAGMTHGPASPL
jgi:hypothetical protein